MKEKTRTNEKTELLMSFNNANLTVDYCWDSHGKQILWNEHVERPTDWSKANVEISRLSFTQLIANHSFNFEALQLKVNGVLLGGEVTEVDAKYTYDDTLNVYCKVTVGWG